MLASGVAVFSSAYQFAEHTSQMYFARIQEAVDQPSSSDCALLWYKSDFLSALNFFQSNLSEMAMASYILSTFISCHNLVKKWFLIV